MKTTLNKIRVHDPWIMDWSRLLDKLNKTEGDDEELSMLKILDITHPLDIRLPLWCLRAVDGYDDEIRAFTLWCRQLAYPHETLDSMVQYPFDVYTLVNDAMVHISTQSYRESRENPNEADMVVYKGLVNKGYDAFFLESKSPWLKASNCAWGATRMDIKKELRRVLEEIELKEKT
jgi:hypothetical protein